MDEYIEQLLAEMPESTLHDVVIIAHFLPGLPLFRLPYSGVLAQLVRKTYLAYIHSNPNCPCTQNTPGLHTLGPQFSTIGTRFWHTLHAKHTWPTYTRTPIFHHHRHGVLAQLARRTHLAYIPSNPNCPCAKMRFGFGFGFDCPCAKTRPAYIYYSAFFAGATAVSATI